MESKTIFSLFAAILSGAAISPVAAQENGRLFYEMVVTNPGTRSQGWHGVLFGPDGNPVQADPDAIVETSVGRFRNLPCQLLWQPCGFIRLDTPPAPAGSFAALIDNQPWTFRLYILGEGSRSEGWAGALFHGDSEAIRNVETPTQTPFGSFIFTGESETLWGWSGWLPVGWD